MRFRHALVFALALISLPLAVVASADAATTAVPTLGTSPAAAVGASSSAVTTGSVAATTSVEKAGLAIVAMTAGDVRTGSGIVIGPGLVLTSTRVISKNPQVITSVMTAGGNLLAYRLLAHDDQLGLALLSVDTPQEPQVLWGDSSKLIADDKVVALGMGTGNRELETLKGTVSSPPAATGNDFVLTDIKLDPLIEGGALLTPDGKVVGIVTAKSTDRVAGELGWAVTSKAAQAFIAAYNKQQSDALANAARSVADKWFGRGILLVFLIIVFFLGRGFRRWYKRMEAREDAAMAVEQAAREAQAAEEALAAEGHEAAMAGEPAEAAAVAEEADAEVEAEAPARKARKGRRRRKAAAAQPERESEPASE